MMHRPLFIAVSTVSLIGLVGCTGANNPFARSDDAQAARLASAVQAEYPTTQPSEKIDVVAIVDNDGVTLANRTDQPIRNAKVWVNRSFVHEVDLLPAGGQLTIKQSEFYSKQGYPMSRFETQINTIQIETEDGFYNVDAPVFN